MDHSSIEAHHHRLSDSTSNATTVLSATPFPEPCLSPPTSERALDLSKCLDIVYENRDYVPGLSFKTLNGEEGWTPVVRKKRITKTRRAGTSSENESDGSGSEIDV